MEVKIYCPKCAQEYTIDDYGEGKPVECAKCKHVFSLSKTVVQKTPSPAAKMQTAYNCPVCGGKVSPAAYTCPHCGQPLKKRKKCRSLKGGLICLAITFIQPFLTAPLLDKAFGGGYDATGGKVAVAISIGFFVAALVCLTAPSREV